VLKFAISLAVAAALWLTFCLSGLAPASAASGDEGCEPAGEYAFLCGLPNAEDLVLIPGTQWVLASSLAPAGGILLVDAGHKTWSRLYPGEAPLARHDRTTYGACPGAPEPAGFVTHGLNLLPGADGNATLYAVGHGGREAIEVFDVDASGDVPLLTWTGCVPTPDGMAANSVTSLADGSLLVTIPLRTGITISDALAGRSTGGVYAWSPGDAGFSPVEGTDMPYANGIEVSSDGTEFYVASSGLQNVTAFSNTNPARRLRETATLSFVPDNLHMAPDGRLLTAGLNIDDPECGPVKRTQEFTLEEFAACPRAFMVVAIEPRSFAIETLATGPSNPAFSNITMALPVGSELWIGTFAGDRIAYRPLP